MKAFDTLRISELVYAESPHPHIDDAAAVVIPARVDKHDLTSSVHSQPTAS